MLFYMSIRIVKKKPVVTASRRLRGEMRKMRLGIIWMRRKIKKENDQDSDENQNKATSQRKSNES